MVTRPLFKVTARSAAALQWHGKPYVEWDDDVKGYGVYVWGKGKAQRAYIVQVKRDGRSFRKSLGLVGEKPQEQARSEAIAYKGVVKAGRDPKAEEKAERGAWRLEDAMDYFRGTHATARKLSDGHLGNSETAWKHHTPARWKNMRLADISHNMVAARHREITGGVTVKGTPVRGGAARANQWLALMSKLFELGMTQGHCTLNAAKGVKKNETTERDRFLSQAELATLWNHLERHRNVEAAVCVQFILLTGCRPGEAFTMKWTDVNLGSGLWTKPPKKTKQRKQHSVQLTRRALEVLGRLDKRRSAYVFPSPKDPLAPRSDKLKAFWRAVRKNCGFPDVRLYDCRHSFASWLAMGGATEPEIAKQLGHSNTQTTRRYVHIAEQHARSKAEIMGNVIEEALRTLAGASALQGDGTQRLLVVEKDRKGRLALVDEQPSIDPSEFKE